MADQLYLSYWIRGFRERDMLRCYEKLLRLFPFSRLANRPSIFRVYGVDRALPPVVEQGCAPGADASAVLAAAREFQNADVSFELECWWDLWQFDEEWKLEPSRTWLICFGPDFDRELGENLRIEFGVDANFLPQTELPDSLRMAQSNIRSLLKLTHDLDDELGMERRSLWSESGDNFAEKLQEALGRAEG